MLRESTSKHRHKNHAGYFTVRSHIRVWVTEHVEDYRQVAKSELRFSDAALELGCAGGATTAVAGKVASWSIGVDRVTCPRVLALQKKLARPHVIFRTLDAEDVGGLLRLQEELRGSTAALAGSAPRARFEGFTAIFVDLSGSRDLGTVLGLVEKLEQPNVFGGTLRLIVIKSYRLACLVPRCTMLYDEAKPELELGSVTPSFAQPWWWYPLRCSQWGMPLILLVLLLRSRGGRQ